MPRFPGLLIMAVFLGCNRGTTSRVVLPPGGIALDSTGAVTRHFRGDSLRIVSQLGGSERDTALLDPYIIAAFGNRVYVVEGDQLVKAYDTLSRPLWTSGRNGSGPGEFRDIRDVKVAG